MDSLDKLNYLTNKLANLPSIDRYAGSFDAKSILDQIPIVEIDEESTFAYQMQQQTDQIIEKSNEQIRLLNQHNEQLVSNYKKLEDLYALKEKELGEAMSDAKKAKRYNVVMMIISIVSMLVAVAAWLLPKA